MSRFKLVRVMMGSGWPSGHVAIDEYYTFPDKAGGNEKCLTLDAENFEEFSREIDGLISELEGIRTTARERFKVWQSDWELSRQERELPKPD